MGEVCALKWTAGISLNNERAKKYMARKARHQGKSLKFRIDFTRGCSVFHLIGSMGGAIVPFWNQALERIVCHLGQLRVGPNKQK